MVARFGRGQDDDVFAAADPARWRPPARRRRSPGRRRSRPCSRLREYCGSACASAASKRWPAAVAGKTSRCVAAAALAWPADSAARRDGWGGHAASDREVASAIMTNRSIPTHPHVRIDDPTSLPAASVAAAAPARRAGAAGAAGRLRAGCPRSRTRPSSWTRRAALQRGARRDARGKLYAGDQALRDARGALSLRPLRAAGDPRVGLRELPRRRDRRRHRACDRFIRTYPNHPNVDYAYYLKGLVHFREDQGLLGYVYELDLSEREPKGMRESFAAFKELVAKFPDSRYAEDSIARMKYLTNALATYEVKVARYYYNRGAYVAAVNRAQGGADQLPAHAGQRGRARRAGQGLRQAGPGAAARRLGSASSRRRSRTATYVVGPPPTPWWKFW